MMLLNRYFFFICLVRLLSSPIIDKFLSQTFFTFVNKHESLDSLLPQFLLDYTSTLEDLKAFDCKPKFIAQNYSHMVDEIPLDTKLELFLPVNDGPGVLAMALWRGREGDEKGDWTGLPNIQNRVHRLIHVEYPEIIRNREEESPVEIFQNDSKDIRETDPQQLTPSQVMWVDDTEIAQIINDLFLVPNFRPTIAGDLPLAERLCMYGGPRLASFPPLLLTLPEFSYAGEQGLHALFRAFETKLARAHEHFAPLSSSLARRLDTLFQNAPHSSDDIFAFCAAVLIQGNQQVTQLAPYVNRVEFTIPLSDEQQRGKDILHDFSSLKSIHIPALMGFCKRKKAFFHSSTDLPLNEEELKELREGLERIKQNPEFFAEIPFILSEVRVAALSHFGQEKSQYEQETPLADYCEFFIAVREEVFDDLEQLIPFCNPVGSFGTIVREMETIFGDVEMGRGGGEERESEGEIVVPFAALRHFLQPKENLEEEVQGEREGKGKEREEKGKGKEEKGKEREEKGKEREEKGKERERNEQERSRGVVRWDFAPDDFFRMR